MTTKPPNFNLLLFILFAITSLIYFANVAYEYFVIKPADGGMIVTNIGLGIMFFIIGLTMFTIKSEK